MNQPHARAETFSQVWAMEFSLQTPGQMGRNWTYRSSKYAENDHVNIMNNSFESILIQSHLAFQSTKPFETAPTYQLSLTSLITSLGQVDFKSPRPEHPELRSLLRDTIPSDRSSARRVVATGALRAGRAPLHWSRSQCHEKRPAPWFHHDRPSELQEYKLLQHT